MKSPIIALTLISVLGFIPVSHAEKPNSNTSIEEVKKETQELLQAINSYSVDKKDVAVHKAKQGLSKLDKRISALEMKIDNSLDQMNDAARKETRENLKALHKQRNQVAEWYGSMKTSSADAWAHVKTGFSEAYKDLENAWEKSEKEFSSSK